MIRCYGFAYSDPFSIFSYLKQTYVEHKITVFSKVKNYSVEYPDVLIFMSVKELVIYLRKYPDNRLLGIVFDSSVRLHDIKGLVKVDCKLDRYALMPLHVKNINNWFDIKQLNRNSLDDIEHSPRNLINLLIKFNIEGRFINYYNSFVYSIPIVKRRETCKLLLIKYLFGLVSYEQFIADSNVIVKKRVSNIRKSLDLVVTFLDSEIGKRLLEALQESKDKNESGDFHRYKRISKKYNIDSYEVRYLHHLYLQFKKAGALDMLLPQTEDLEA